jgi:hypothetical protein
MMRIRSAEQWTAEFDEVLRRYRPALGEAPAPHGALNRVEAVAALRQLGFSSGDALRLLRRKTEKA